MLSILVPSPQPC